MFFRIYYYILHSFQHPLDGLSRAVMDVVRHLKLRGLHRRWTGVAHCHSDTCRPEHPYIVFAVPHGGAPLQWDTIPFQKEEI